MFAKLGGRTWALLTWVSPLSRLAKTRTLTPADVPPVGTGVSGWHSRFQVAWRRQRARGKRASVATALVQTFWPTFVVVALLKMMADAVVFVPPLLLKEITKVPLLLGLVPHDPHQGCAASAWAAAQLHC